MSEFLNSLSPEQREPTERTAERLRFESGQAVFNRGDPGLAIYVIGEGCVRIHDGDRLLNRLAEGDVLGEIAGLSEMKWTASDTAEKVLTTLFSGQSDPFRCQARP
jgi:CRP-like cAMP-binding protein